MSPASRARLSALHHDGLQALEADVWLLDSLTRQEREVLDLLTAGHRPAQAATAMVVATPTVRTHIRHILRKLGVNSVQQATRSSTATWSAEGLCWPRRRAHPPLARPRGVAGS